MIIAEGPDGGGKTTLLAEIAKQSGRTPFHPGSPPKDRQMLLARFEQALGHNDNALLDRLPMISELVYRPALEGRHISAPSEVWSYIDRLQQLRHPLFVYCRPPDSTVIGNIYTVQQQKTHKPQQLTDRIARQIHWILKFYDEVMVKALEHGLTVIPYNFETRTPVSMARLLLEKEA